MSLALFDVFSEAFQRNPYPVYRQYREQDPVHLGKPVQPGMGPTWHVFSHTEVTLLLKDLRLGHANDAVEPELKRFRSMLLMDPPDHTRLRRLVSKAFTPRAVDRIVPRIGALAEEVLNDLGDRRTIDVIADFAFPLPVTVICEMLGMPGQDRGNLRQWSRAVIAGFDASPTPETLAAAREANLAMQGYIAARIDDHRRHPRDDVLSALIAARDEEDRLSEDELVAMVNLLIVAGHETTVNLIGNGLLALLTHPDQRERARRDGLNESAVEELLRYDAPIQGVLRVCLEDIEILGRRLAAASPVTLWLGAANRDPALVPDPDQLDLDRYNRHHLAFGGGIHTCLGAPLARAEGRTALHTLLGRYPSLALADRPLRWRRGVFFRGLEELPVRV